MIKYLLILLDILLGPILTPHLKNKWEKLIIIISIAVDLYATDQGQLGLGEHPLVMQDRLQELQLDLVHVVRQVSHLVAGRRNRLYMGN